MIPMCERKELKNWKFTLDQTKYGEGAGWARPEYDDSRWSDVESYTAWETYEQAMNDYEGCGWFRTHLQAKEGGSKLLHFDGIGGTQEISDSSMLPQLWDAFAKAGFHESEIEKIAYGNVMRVIKESMK